MVPTANLITNDSSKKEVYPWVNELVKDLLIKHSECIPENGKFKSVSLGHFYKVYKFSKSVTIAHCKILLRSTIISIAYIVQTIVNIFSGQRKTFRRNMDSN